MHFLNPPLGKRTEFSRVVPQSPFAIRPSVARQSYRMPSASGYAKSTYWRMFTHFFSFLCFKIGWTFLKPTQSPIFQMCNEILSSQARPNDTEICYVVDTNEKSPYGRLVYNRCNGVYEVLISSLHGKRLKNSMNSGSQHQNCPLCWDNFAVLASIQYRYKIKTFMLIG